MNTCRAKGEYAMGTAFGQPPPPVRMPWAHMHSKEAGQKNQTSTIIKTACTCERPGAQQMYRLHAWDDWVTHQLEFERRALLSTTEVHERSTVHTEQMKNLKDH